MRRWWIETGIVVAAVLAAESAQACMMCSQDLVCAWSPAGGRWCLSGTSLCMLGGLCGIGGGDVGPKPVEAMPYFQLSLVAPVPGSAPAASRVVRGAGEVATGRHALRIARRGAEPQGGDERIVFTGNGVAGAGTAVFRTRAGDGFTLSLESDGRGATARVCALAGDGPGREIARERLGETDALVVPVSFEGRPVQLVLQAATLGEAEGRRRRDAAADAAREATWGRPQPDRPPFELRVLDR